MSTSESELNNETFGYKFEPEFIQGKKLFPRIMFPHQKLTLMRIEFLWIVVLVKIVQFYLHPRGVSVVMSLNIMFWIR